MVSFSVFSIMKTSNGSVSPSIQCSTVRYLINGTLTKLELFIHYAQLVFMSECNLRKVTYFVLFSAKNLKPGDLRRLTKVKAEAGIFTRIATFTGHNTGSFIPTNIFEQDKLMAICLQLQNRGIENIYRCIDLDLDEYNVLFQWLLWL